MLRYVATPKDRDQCARRLGAADVSPFRDAVRPDVAGNVATVLALFR
jgi:hypothetical protein